MDQQRRVLSGMTNGLPVAIPVAASPAATIHVLDAAPTAGDRDGRPFMDVLSLYLANSDATNPAAVEVVFTPPGGAAVTTVVSVPAREIVRVFDETAFGGTPLGSMANAPLGGASLTVRLQTGASLSDTATAWGWFVRS